MDLIRQKGQSEKLFTLQETSQKLGVSVEVLLKWNDNHILSPKITLAGEIGYTSEQINQFLMVRDTLSHTKHSTSSPLHTRAMPSYLLLGGVILTTAACVSIFLTQQDKFISLLHSAEASYQRVSSSQNVLSAQSSTARIPEPIVTISPTQLNDTDNKLHTQNQSVFAKNIFAPSPTPTRKLVGQKQDSAIATTQAVKTLENPPTGVSSQGNINTDKNTTLASVSHTASTMPTGSVLDGNDNITGNTQPNALATILGAGMVHDSSMFQEVNIDFKNQILFLLTSGMIVFFMIIRSQRKVIPGQYKQQFQDGQKAAEVSQKMDGTVVLLFQGKEYKISKPELYSDSDRFFERLMDLMDSGVKEIEYDSLTDSTRITTPLSRLVTRLGFVGIKRDLFFPRTSKNRVLFRKYLTQEDLSAMHLTNNQITQQLLQIS